MLFSVVIRSSNLNYIPVLHVDLFSDTRQPEVLVGMGEVISNIQCVTQSTHMVLLKWVGQHCLCVCVCADTQHEPTWTRGGVPRRGVPWDSAPSSP